MKAIVFERYGPPEVLVVKEVDKPITNSNEVLIKVKATSVTQGDWKMRKPSPLMARLYNGLIKPKRVNILGFELSGIIEEVGSDVTEYKIGDEVFAFTGFGFGAYAEYRCLPVDGDYKKGLLSMKPSQMTFEEAAVVPGGCLTAYSHLKKVELNADSKVLVYGASGSVGSYFVQLSKCHKAHVTAVCSSRNSDMMKSLGVDQVIDYKLEDFRHGDVHYDLIFDAVNKLKASTCKNVLSKTGRYISVTSKTTIEKGDLNEIKTLIEEDHIKVVIDRSFSCYDIVEAHKYVEAGHKSGNVSLLMDL